MVSIDQDTLRIVLGFFIRKELCALQLISYRLNRLISTAFGQNPILLVCELRAFWVDKMRIEFYKSTSTNDNRVDDDDEQHVVFLEPNGSSFLNIADNIAMVPRFVRINRFKIDVRTKGQVRQLNQALMCFDQCAFESCHFIIYSWPEAFSTRQNFIKFLRSSPLCTFLQLAASIRIIGPHLPHLDSSSAKSSTSAADTCDVLSLFHNVQKIELDFWFPEWPLVSDSQSSSDVSDADDDNTHENDVEDIEARRTSYAAAFNAKFQLTIDVSEVADWLHSELAPPSLSHTKNTIRRHAIVSACSLWIYYNQAACVQFIEVLIKRFMDDGAVANHDRHRPFLLELTGCVSPVHLVVCQQGPIHNLGGELFSVTNRQLEFKNYVITLQRWADNCSYMNGNNGTTIPNHFGC